MKHLTEIESQQYMSSREIAKLTGKNHNHVIRDIDKTISQCNSNNPKVDFLAKTTTYTVGNSLIKYREYLLPRRECEILVTGYDVARRAKVIDRWFELESEKASKAPLIPQSFADALQLAADLEREKQLALADLEEAKRTKAHINDKRTATLMGKAGADAKRIKKLESQLQDQGTHISILAAKLPERIDTDSKKNLQTWRVLKALSENLGYEIIKVSDPRFGEVNTYDKRLIEKFKQLYM